MADIMYHRSGRDPSPGLHHAIFQAALAPSRRSPVMQHAESFPLRIVGIVFSFVAGVVCIAMIGHRFYRVPNWRKTSYMQWFVLFQISVALCFIVVSAVLRYGFDSSAGIKNCRVATDSCLVLYTMVKGLFYVFLADRLHVVWTCGEQRSKSKLYILHYFLIAGVIVSWNVVLFYNATTHIADGVCVVGAIRELFITVIMFDFALNLYFTIFFLCCLSRSFRLSGGNHTRWFRSSKPALSNGRPLSRNLRALTRRTIIGLIINLTATSINVGSMIIMGGEAMWFCWLICKADIMVSIVVLFWITTPGTDRESTKNSTTRSSTKRFGSTDSSAGLNTTIAMVELSDVSNVLTKDKSSLSHEDEFHEIELDPRLDRP